jgi:UDP-glucuronate decarboxylase
MVEGLIRMMEGPDDLVGPVNLGNPTEHSILELAQLIISLAGSPSVLEFFPAPEDDPKRRQPDIELARRELDWEPKVAVEEGLEKTIYYFRELLREA